MSDAGAERQVSHDARRAAAQLGRTWVDDVGHEGLTQLRLEQHAELLGLGVQPLHVLLQPSHVIGPQAHGREDLVAAEPRRSTLHDERVARARQHEDTDGLAVHGVDVRQLAQDELERARPHQRDGHLLVGLNVGQVLRNVCSHRIVHHRGEGRVALHVGLGQDGL